MEVLEFLLSLYDEGDISVVALDGALLVLNPHYQGAKIPLTTIRQGAYRWYGTRLCIARSGIEDVEISVRTTRKMIESVMSTRLGIACSKTSRCGGNVTQARGDRGAVQRTLVYTRDDISRTTISRTSTY